MGGGGEVEKFAGVGIESGGAVVLNSGLNYWEHHVAAIVEAFDCLRPGGQLVLVNENMLKPWTSQKRFKRLLEIDPVGMGHYGGNEHAYHNQAYIRMIMTSFRNVELLIPRMESALDELEILLARKLADRRIYSTNLSVMSRFAFYMLKEKVRTRPELYKLFARLSLMPVHFRSYKYD